MAALLSKAFHNTNTVKTLIYTQTTTQTSSSIKATIVFRGEEDEVANREADHETVTAQIRQTNGKTQKVHYTLDIVFMQGQTYYRSSLQHNQWHMKKGMTFQDGFLGTVWKRGRTMVSFKPMPTFSLVGHSGGQTQVRAHVSDTHGTGTVDLFISGGSQPYVVIQDTAGKETIGGQTIQSKSETKYGPFNQTLNIQAPANGA